MVRAFPARKVVAARRGGVGHQRVELALGEGPSSIEVDVRHPERRRQRLGRLDLARQLVAEAREMAQVGIARGVDHDRPLDLDQPRLRRDRDRADMPVTDDGRLHEAMQQDADAGVAYERLPGDLEQVGMIGDPGARAVGVRSLEDGAEAPQPGHHVISDPADHLDGIGSGRPEPVERVEDRRARAAQEWELLDQQHRRPAARGSQRRRGPGRPRPDDDHIERERGGHRSASASPSASFGGASVTRPVRSGRRSVTRRSPVQGWPRPDRKLARRGGNTPRTRARAVRRPRSNPRSAGSSGRPVALRAR